MWYRVLVFLLLNFAALGIGGIFTRKGVPSDWYLGLHKGPWTPAGWVFGFAWTLIMFCFAFYMAQAWVKVENVQWLIVLYAVQWVFNVAWNPAFFYYHQVFVGLIIIVLLTLMVGYFLIGYWSSLHWVVLWVLPYFVWLIVATSLNAYIFIKN